MTDPTRSIPNESVTPSVEIRDTPTQPATRPLPGKRWPGIVALVYAIAACGFEVAVIISANSVMESSLFQDLFAVMVPILLVGIALCLVVGIRSRRSRRMAVIGGWIMALPMLLLLAAVVIVNVTNF